MDARITNRIRYVLDGCLPPLVRDSKLFMYPLFYHWFKGKNIERCMEFKSIAHKLSDEEFEEVYRTTECVADDRPSDTHPDSLAYAIDQLPKSAKTLLDVGCGRGHFLRTLGAKRPDLELTGCDLMAERPELPFRYAKGGAEKLPFPDKSFDVVTCFHTLEHTRKLDRAISELFRVARQQVAIIVPCQRYFHYTLDLHLHFFPTLETLEACVGYPNYCSKRFSYDLVYIADLTQQQASVPSGSP